MGIQTFILIDERDDVKASSQSFAYGLLGHSWRASRGVEGRLPRLPLDALVPYITSFHARSCSLNSHAPISHLRYLAPLSPRVWGCIGDICCAPSRSLPPFSSRSCLVLVPTDPAQFVHVSTRWAIRASGASWTIRVALSTRDRTRSRWCINITRLRLSGGTFASLNV